MDSELEVTPVPEEAKEEKSTPKPKEKKAVSTPATGNMVVKLKDITLPEKWNRDKPGNLNSLVASIKSQGQIVALVVRPDTDKAGKYILVDGRRRFMAMQELKMAEAFVTLSEGDDVESYTKALTANLNREGHTPMEVASAIGYLLEQGKKNREIARDTGMSEAFVSQHKALLELPGDVQSAINKGVLSLTQARVLQRVNEEEHSGIFYKLFEQMLNGLGAETADEKVNLYFDKLSQKEKEAKRKAKSSGSEDGEEEETPKKRGRPKTAVAASYDDKRNEIKPLTKTDLLGALNGASERYARTTSDKNKLIMKGLLMGLEIAAGLRASE
jgi:ParB/RepB/Spo0J family partition protein